MYLFLLQGFTSEKFFFANNFAAVLTLFTDAVGYNPPTTFQSQMLPRNVIVPLMSADASNVVLMFCVIPRA